MARILDVDRAKARERKAVAAVARRQHAVEHVDAARDRLQRDRPACRRPSDSAAGRRAAPARPPRSSPASPPAARRPRGRRSRSRRKPMSTSARALSIAQLPDRRRPARCRTARRPARPRLRRRACSAPPSAATAASRARSRPASPAAAGIRRAAWRCRSRAASGSRWRAPGVSSTMAPSRCERNVTPFSSTLRSSASDMTWKPPESVRIGTRPVHEGVQAAERRDALGARPQHQMIGVAEHDIGAGRAHIVGCTPLTLACVPTGMKAGVRTRPCGVAISPLRAAPSVAMRRKEKCGQACLSSSRCAEQQGRRRHRNRSGSRPRWRAHRRAASRRGRRRPRPA